MKHLIIISCLTIFMAASCNKNEYPEPGPNDFYFRCKIDGRLYIPNSCANCMSGKLLGDTTFLVNGNAGYEALGFGIINETAQPIIVSSYILDNNPRYKGSYKFSNVYNDIFKTDSDHKGVVIITSIDKANRIIQGTFYFKAYNTYRNDSVSVTDGKFRLKYTID